MRYLTAIALILLQSCGQSVGEKVFDECVRNALQDGDGGITPAELQGCKSIKANAEREARLND